ncbi:MAG: hypothetical protein ACJASL_004027 [Paraglaciecola sp.]|jgi:hypothetical protein
MFTKSKIAATLLTASIAFSSTVLAKEATLEQLVHSMMSQAVTTTQQELQYNVQDSILLSATNTLTADDEKMYFAKVTIPDLDDAEVTQAQAE